MVSAHGQPKVASNEEVRTLSMRVGERALAEFNSAWSEYRSIVDLGGADDGTRLNDFMMSACREPRRDFWMNTSVWLTEHVSETKGPRVARVITKRFRKRLKEGLKDLDHAASAHRAAVKKGEADGSPSDSGFASGYMVLHEEETMLGKAKSHEADLRQRAEILLALRTIVSSLSQQHEIAPKHLDYGLGFALTRRTQCEFGDAGADYMKEFLELERSEALDEKTQLALLIIFINVNDLEEKRELLEMITSRAQALSDDPAFALVFQASFNESVAAAAQ